jgi:hypothetical protein
MSDFDVRGHLGMLVADEPPFEQPAVVALDRAVRSGARLQRRTISLACLATAATVAVGSAAVVALTSRHLTTTPASPSSAAATPDPERSELLASERAVALDPRYEAGLRLLVRDLAGQANQGAPITMKNAQEAILVGKSAQRDLRVDAWRAPTGQHSVALASAACLKTQACQVESLSANEGFFVTGVRGPGTQISVEFVRDLRGGASLVVGMTGTPSIDPGFDGEPYFTVQVVRAIVDASSLVR